MDADISNVIAGSPSPTVNEQLYALTIQDYRNALAAHEAATAAANEDRDAALAATQAYRQEYLALIARFEAKFNAVAGPMDGLENFAIYQSCFRDAFDARAKAQGLTSATTWTTKLACINDAFRMADEMYPRLLAKKNEIVAAAAPVV